MAIILLLKIIFYFLIYFSLEFDQRVFYINFLNVHVDLIISLIFLEFIVQSINK
jgi:hypothetical protein